MNYFWLAEAKGIFEELDGWIRSKLRGLIWRQCKRTLARAKGLMKRGLDECRYGSQRRMAEARGGMPGPRTCTLPSLNPTLIVVDSCRCWSNGSVSSGLYEPPYTEPHVRWFGRTAEVTPPPTRFLFKGHKDKLFCRRLIRLSISSISRLELTGSPLRVTLRQ